MSSLVVRFLHWKHTAGWSYAWHVRFVLALALAFASGCMARASIRHYSVRSYEPLLRKAIFALEDDLAALERAQAVPVGTISARGGFPLPRFQQRRRMRVKAARHGATHILRVRGPVTPEQRVTVLSWPGVATAQSRTVYVERGFWVAVRVEPENWSMLPAYLRP